MMKPLTIVVALSFVANAVARAQLHDILFSDWGRLCSVSVTGTKPACLPGKRDYGEMIWNPDRETLLEDGGLLLDQKGARIGVLHGRTGVRRMWSPDGSYLFAIDYQIGSAVRRLTRDGKSQRIIPVVGGDSAK